MQFLQWDLSRLASAVTYTVVRNIELLGLTVADAVGGCTRALGGSDSLMYIIVLVGEIGSAIPNTSEYVGWVVNTVQSRRSHAICTR